MLGAIFMATDYATSPVTKPGQLIFGLGCGLLTCFIRRFGSYPEGVCYSILIMNCTTWLLDKYIRPVIYGAPKKEMCIRDRSRGASSGRRPWRRCPPPSAA